MTVQLEVWRQSGDFGKPRFEEYNVEAESNWSILDCLEAISRRDDPSLAYRDNCFASVCGECGMIANGREILACAARASDFPGNAGNAIRIELRPLRNHAVIRDLVVDRKPYFDRLSTAGAFFAIGERRESAGDEIMRSLQTVTRCLNCGICDSACEAFAVRSDFAGPSAIAWILRFARDPRDADPAQRQAVLASPQGLTGCVDCGACSQVCPEAIPIHEMIREAR